jgi:RNA polymerase sigma-70 factor (ECF subfamily)
MWGMNDATWSHMDGWLRGDEDAVRAMFAAYYPNAVRLAVVSGLPPPEAQDSAQEAFIHAFEKRQQLRDPKAFPLWFHRIVTRHILDAMSVPQRKHEAILDESQLARRTSPATAPDELAIRAEERDDLWSWVESLPGHYRVPLALRYFGGFTTREIAEMLDAREGTVRVTLHRALTQLRERMVTTQWRERAPSQS